MGKVSASAEGQFPPERFVEALTDFGAGRSLIWGNSSDSLLEVHDRGDTWAEVTEGAKAAGIWQRSRYDWGTPGRVRLDVLESNAFGPGSSWTYDVRATGAGCHVDLVIIRKPTTTKGRLVEPFLRVFGGIYFGRDLRRTMKRLESMN